MALSKETRSLIMEFQVRRLLLHCTCVLVSVEGMTEREEGEKEGNPHLSFGKKTNEDDGRKVCQNGMDGTSTNSLYGLFSSCNC